MNESGIKFRPVMGTKDFIEHHTEISPGWLYFATDTGDMWLDLEHSRVSVGGAGGSGGSSSSFVWAHGDESQILKLVEDDEDYSYSIAYDALDVQVAPKKDVLILNSDGRFFRVQSFNTEDNLIIADLIAVSGSGGGGGGTVHVDDLSLAIDSTTLARNFILVQGKDYEALVTATSTVDEDITLYLHATGENGYSKDMTYYGKSGVPVAINLNFLPINNNITIKIEADSDNTKMKTLPVRTVSNIKVVEMTIAKPANVNTAKVNTGSALIEYYLYGDPNLSETIHVYIDGIEDESLRKSDSVSSSMKSITVPKQAHGVHVIQLSVSTEIQDKEMESEKISYEIAWSDPEDMTPIIWTGDYADTVIQYEPFVVKYQVYDPATSGSTTNDPFTVYIQKSGVRVGQIEKRYTAGEWLTLDLTELYDLGENNFSLICGSTSKAITFYVTDVGSRDLSIQPEDYLVMNLSSTGRSNDEIAATRSVWENGPYVAQFNNFNWYNNGWKNDDDGNGAYLSVANGASVTIPFRNYATNPIEDFKFNSTTSYTFEARFRIRNVQEYSTLVTTNPYYYIVDENGVKSENGVAIAVIKENGYTVATDEDGNWLMDKVLTKKITKTTQGVCLKILNNANYGLCIGTQEAYFSSKEGTTNVRYKEDEIINFSVVVSTQEKLVSIYLNGILSGSLNLGNDSSSAFNCGNLIEINSDYCDIDIYKLRFFSSGLTMPEIIHNYISDIHDLSLYDQNQLVKEDPTLLSYTKLVEYNRKMLEEDNIDALTMPYAVIEIIDNKTGMVNPNGGVHSLSDDLLPWKKGNNRYCKITFVNPTLDALYNSGQITAEEYETHSPSYVAIGADINVQGTSSQGYPRRNFKTKMGSAVDGIDANKVVHEDWGWFYTNEKFINEAKDGEARFSKWKQDNPNYGTNKYTWKIDYMESSGSYNTGFANLVGNNIYTTHPLGYYHIDGIKLNGLRTSVYGFPCLTFHKHSTPTDDAKVGTKLEDEIYEYIGRYNINQDKGSEELFGFKLKNEQTNITKKKEVIDPETGQQAVDEHGDPVWQITHPQIKSVAECWEFLDNQGSWCSFKYPDNVNPEHPFATYTNDSYDENHELKPDPKLEVIRHFECRYHKNADFIEAIASDEAPYNLAEVNKQINDPDVDEEDKEIWRSINTIPKMNDFILANWGNWEKVVTWVDSTDTSKADPTKDITPIEYEVPKFPTDLTGATTREADNIKYVTFTKDTAAYRLEKFRNEFEKHFNLEYCTVYFVMTELLLCYDSRGKNMMMASYGPVEEGGEYIWFPIFYDIDTQLGLNNIGATLWDYDTDATLEQAFSTPTSVLWVNFLSCFSSNIENKYQDLRASNKLTYDNIDGAYMCSPETFNSYAMRGLRPIIAIGLDEYYKYVAPSKTGYYNTEGQKVYDNNSYSYAVNGDRMLSRELLLRNRLNYMDSYWVAGNYTPSGMAQGGIRMRANANVQGTSDTYLTTPNGELPSNAWQGEQISSTYPVPYYDATPNFEVTPFLSQYVFSYNDKQPSSIPVKYQGTPVSVIPTGSEAGYRATPGLNEQIVYLPAEDYISSAGDLSTKYLSQFTMNGGKRLLDITIGSDAPGYYNSLLGAGSGQFNINASKYLATEGRPLNPNRKTLLKKINLTNVTSLADPLDISGSEKMVECRILGTQIPYVTFAEGAPLDCIHLPWTVNKIDLVEATNLTRILTSKPEVWQNSRDNYTGLYVEDLTDSFEDENHQEIKYHTKAEQVEEDGHIVEKEVRQLNKIDYINIVGGKLGYDSYTLLNKLVKIKDFEDQPGCRIKINLENVVWTPYIMVESGTPYDTTINSGSGYWKLTDHSTFVRYTFSTTDQWKVDTLNGLVFTYNNNPKKSLITSAEMLERFIRDYQEADASSTKESHYTNLEKTLGYPSITGAMYIDNENGESIEEFDITEKYGVIWKNLKIYAAQVSEAYVAKFMQRNVDTNQDKQVYIKRYRQNGTVYPEYPNDLEPLYPNYDFKGWSLNPAHTIVEQEEFDQLLANNTVFNSTNATTWLNNHPFSESNDVYVFYAVFVPHPFHITFDIGNDQTVVVDTPFNHVINLPPSVPYRDESALQLEEKYAFLGYARSSTATKPIDMSKEKAIRDTKYYAVFKKSSVHENPLTSEYLLLRGPMSFSDGKGGTKTGYELGLNPIYSYQGKITLPAYIDDTPILGIMAGTYEDKPSPNGLCRDNNHKNQVTHIFWDTSKGEPQLLRIGNSAFFGCQELTYVEFPDTLDYIDSMAFANSAVGVDRIAVRYISDSAWNSAIANMPTLQIEASVQEIYSNAFSYIRSLKHVIIGREGQPSQLRNLPAENGLFVGYTEDITVYTDNVNSPEWQKAPFTDFSGWSGGIIPTVNIIAT